MLDQISNDEYKVPQSILDECEAVRKSGMTKQQIEEEANTPSLFEQQLATEIRIQKLRDDEDMSFSEAVAEINDSKLYTRIQMVYLAREEYKIFLPDGKLIENKNGRLVPKPKEPENLECVISKVCNYKVRLNQLKGVVEVNGKQAEDSDLYHIGNNAIRYDLDDSDSRIRRVFWTMAEKNSYHPFKQYVESTPWDGVDRISQLASTVTIRESFRTNEASYSLYLRRWLIGVVAKVYHPGAQNTVYTLQGDQGVGKSRWLRKLQPVDGCYSEGMLQPENKDHILRHLSFILFHASELDGTTRKSDIAALKDFFTKEDVSERPAYGRLDRSGKSVCSFAASVNEGQFLNDITGSRRYLVIPVEKLDHEHNIDIQQVYAQAKVALDAGEQYWFNSEEIVQLNETNSSFSMENHIDGLAAKVESGEDFLPTFQIFKSLTGRDANHIELGKFGILLKRKGLKGGRKVIGGIKLSGWFVKSPITMTVEF